MARFASGLALIGARWLADYEHLPRPKDKNHKIAALLRDAPTYFSLIASQKLQRLAGGTALEPGRKPEKACLPPCAATASSAFACPPTSFRN